MKKIQILAAVIRGVQSQNEAQSHFNVGTLGNLKMVRPG